MHEQSILDDVLSRLNKNDCKLHKFSIICTEKELISRITKDIQQGIRSREAIDASVPRLKNYFQMDTVKIDVSEISSKEAAEIICRHIQEQ